MTICLNMIVKDEGAVIERCLQSVKSIIDYWVIVDTGSSDATCAIIRNTLKSIPGELHERPWVNFEKNRNEALFLARDHGDYLLFIDADETLEIAKEFNKSSLHQESYYLRLIERDQTDVFRLSLIKDHSAWFWKGVIHEALYASKPMDGAILESLVKHSFRCDGNRTQDPLKFLRDAEILEKALREEPENSRYVFYLAQSYGNAKKYDLALEWYRKRSEMGGYLEEVFWSFYCIGMIEQHIGLEAEKFIESYSKAYLCLPSRAEPLYQLASYFYSVKQPLLAHAFASEAIRHALPPFYMYCHSWVYEYASSFLLAQSAGALGLKEEALARCRLLLQKNLPSDVAASVNQLMQRLA